MRNILPASKQWGKQLIPENAGHKPGNLYRVGDTYPPVKTLKICSSAIQSHNPNNRLLSNKASPLEL